MVAGVRIEGEAVNDPWADLLRNWYRPTVTQSGASYPILSLATSGPDSQMHELAEFRERGWVDTAAHPNVAGAHVHTLTATGHGIVYGNQQAGTVH